MTRLGLLVLMMLSLLVPGLVVATVAGAEVELEAKPPAILLLDGEKAQALKFELKSAAAFKIETVKGKSISCTTTAKVEGKDFVTVGQIRVADTETGLVEIGLENCKKEAIACRSETPGGKDPIQTILIAGVARVATEQSALGSLEAILIVDVVGTDEAALKIFCGAAKYQVLGYYALLIKPSLEEVAPLGAVEIDSQQEKGKPVTGKCLEEAVNCKRVVNEPLLANLGEGLEGAGIEFGLGVEFKKMVFIDG